MDFRGDEQVFTSVRNRIEEAVYTHIGLLNMEAYKSKEPMEFLHRTEGEFFIPKVGETWGDLFDCAWFHFTGNVPENVKGSECAVLVDFSGEGLVYSPSGEIIQGLTSATSRDEFPLGLWGKKSISLTSQIENQGIIDFWVDAGCNDIEGQYRNDGKVKEAVIVIQHTACRELFYNWVVCQSLYVGLCENDDPYGKEIRPILLEAAEVLSAVNDETVEQANSLLHRILDRGNDDHMLTYSSIGHSHLDLLFLWPLRETIRKGARTFSTVLKMMDLYPEYLFGASQVPLYQWIKKHYPELYIRIEKRIQERRWEVQGAFFVECDTNLPSGESLVRQLLYGKQYFSNEFGFDMKVGFLPDVFGYSAALPQLLVKSGTPYFMTQKLSMNDTNRFPMHTFWWQGIDGSKVLTHMLPEDSYNSAAVPQMAIYGLHHYKDLDVCGDALQLYGLGDGGGGPGYEHFERRRRMKNLKGCPSFRDEFVVDFFKRIDQEQNQYRTWRGELYFEKHQGTYTSIAKIKQYNRMTEQALHKLEWLSAIAEIYVGLLYPKQEIDACYEEMLLYQFHDCLPGSSIMRVYEEAYAGYDAMLNQINRLICIAQNALTVEQAEEEQTVTCFNPAPFDREEYVTAYNKVKKVHIPAYGVCELSMEDGLPAETNGANLSKDNQNRLENEYVQLAFSDQGTICEMILKETGFSMLKDGEEGNRLLLYPDELTHWDIDKTYLSSEPEQAKLVSMNKTADAVSQMIHMKYTIGSSMIRQTVVLRNHSARIDLITEVEWNEEYKMLRTSFPTSIQAEQGKCEIQFGHVNRPLHTNTTWDEAKFEVCAHKWVDIADSGSGIALLNDCKYGHKLWDHTLDLCLLRSQNCPAEEGDKGIHKFTYSYYPHTHDVAEGGVIKEGYLLNYPLMILPDSTIKHTVVQEDPLCTSSDQNIVIETIKKAEDGNGYILRLYDSAGKRSKTSLCFQGCKVVALCDLLENEIESFDDSTCIDLMFHPFEVHTLRIKP